LQDLSGSTCPTTPVAGTDPDACVYEYDLAQLARLLKTVFPNLKQIFMQPFTYCGYGPLEPDCYETGFSIKWLIQAQVNQVEQGTLDPLAGDLSYGSAAWMAWAAYTWGAGTTPRA